MSRNEKILVVRVGLGGDLVMITPAVNLLLQAYPEAEFHLLTTQEGQRVMKDYDPRITRFWPYKRRLLDRLTRQRKLARTLRAEGYSRVYIFEVKSFYRNWLAGIAPVVHIYTDPPGQRHFCEKFMDFVAATLDAPVERGWVTLSWSDEGLQKARRLLQEHDIAPGTTLVGLHPTFSGSSYLPFRDRKGQRHRVWPMASFARLARQLRARAEELDRPLAVVIDALPADRAVVEEIGEMSDGNITMLSAPPDFARYKGLLRTLDVLVTPNTGPMHFAAAMGTRVVALFSNWSVDDCGPFVPAEQYEVLEARHTEYPELGLKAISEQQVADAVWRMLDPPPD